MLRVLLLCLPSFSAHFLATPWLPSECAICMTGEVCLDLIETQEDCMQSYSRISIVFFRGKRIFNVFYCIWLDDITSERRRSTFPSQFISLVRAFLFIYRFSFFLIPNFRRSFVSQVFLFRESSMQASMCLQC